MEGCNGGCKIARGYPMRPFNATSRCFLFRDRAVQSLAFYQRLRRLTRSIKFIRRCVTVDLLLSRMEGNDTEWGAYYHRLFVPFRRKLVATDASVQIKQPSNQISRLNDAFSKGEIR